MRKTPYLSLLMTALAVSSSLFLTAQEVFPGGGLGSYNLTEPPDDYQGVNTYDNIGGGAAAAAWITTGPNYPAGPFQTHHWWVSAMWNINQGVGTDGETSYRGDDYSRLMHPQPLIFNTEAAGFALLHRTNANATSGPDGILNGPWNWHVRVGLEGQNATSTTVDDYGDWHAVLRQDWAGNTLLATAGRGMPYLYFEKQGGANFYLQYAAGQAFPIASYADANVEAFLVRSSPQNNPETDGFVAVFLPPGSTVGGLTPAQIGGMGAIGTGNTVVTPNGSNYIAVSILPNDDPATLELFAQHAFNFPRETTHSYAYDEVNSTLTTNFDITSENVYGQPNTGVLQTLFRHQWLYCDDAVYEGISYNSPRGEMKIISGDRFTTRMTHQGILPTLGYANTGDDAELFDLVQEVADGLNDMPTAADGYAKDQFELLVNNVQLAQQVGNLSARDVTLGHLRDRLVDWMVADDGDFNRYFGYSTTYNHMSHFPNGFGSSGTMVDAHFHVGYFVMAAAILARYDQQFVADYGDMVETVIRSINDYRKDAVDPGGSTPWFPYLKYFDPYAGYSSAEITSGGQESVSEAMNFNSGTFLWGITTGNQQLRDLGALLFITEGEAGRQYWYDVDDAVNSQNYANTYAWRHLARVEETGGTHNTFFGGNPIMGYWITYLPISGSSTWIGSNPQGAAANWADIGMDYPAWPTNAAPGIDTRGTGATMSMQQAMHDPKSAIFAYDNYRGAHGWNQELFGMAYHWIHTYDSVGVYDGANVQADISGFGTFVKDSCTTWYRHYMLFNPPGEAAKTVHMTDGTCWALPEDTVVTYALLGPDTAAGLSVDKPSGCSTESYTLTVEGLNVCDNDTVIEYQSSVDNGATWNVVERVSGGNAGVYQIVDPPVGTVQYRAVVINDYPSTPQMLCDLNDTTASSDVAEVVVESCDCPGLTQAVLNFSSDTLLCPGADIDLVVTTDAPTGHVYGWMRVGEEPNPLNGSAGTVDDSTYTANQTGTYYVVITDPSDPTCTLLSDSIDLTVIGVEPTYEIELAASLSEICPNDPIDFTTSLDTNALNRVYTWTVGGIDVLNNLATLTLDTLTKPTEVLVSVEYETTCSTGASQDAVQITVADPAVPSVELEIEADKCVGELLQVSAVNQAGQGNSPVYVWEVGGIVVSETGPIWSSDTLTNGTEITVQMTSSLTCANGAQASATGNVALTDNVDPQLELVSSDDAPCQGETIQVTAQNIVGGGASPTFSWTVNGVADPQNTASIDVLIVAGTNTINVEMPSGSACATQPVGAAFIQVEGGASVDPEANFTVSSNAICANESLEANVNYGVAEPADVVYVWSVNNVVVAGAGSTMTIDTLTKNSIVKVDLSYSYECEVQSFEYEQSISVSSGSDPSVSIAISGGSCEGDELTISAVDITDAGTPTFAWSVNGIPTGESGLNWVSSALVNDDLIALTMTSSLSCSSNPVATAEQVVALSASVVPSMSLAPFTDTICDGDEVILEVVALQGAGDDPTFSWLANGIPAIGGSGTMINTGALNADSDFEVTMTSSAQCAQPTSVTLALQVVVLPNVTPAFELVSSASQVCADETVQLNVVNAVGLGDSPTFQWEVNGEVVSEISAGYQLNVSELSVVVVQADGDDDCLLSTTVIEELTISVEPLKSPAINPLSTRKEVCPDRYEVIGFPGGVDLDGGDVSWFLNGQAVVVPGSDYFATTWAQDDVISVEVVTSHLCQDQNKVTSNDLTIDLLDCELPDSIHAPNTITPNGDGHNDYWVIENLDEFTRYEVLIFNRNGHLVFESDHYNHDWNGEWQGTEKDLPETTYYYIIKLEEIDQTYKGTLTVLRE